MTSDSTAAPADPITESTFVASAAGSDDPPAPVKGLRRLLAWVVPSNVAFYLIWGSVPSILLPQQITTLLGEKDKILNLLIVTTIGAVAAMLAQPIAGQLSDRTRSRFGRRAPWIVVGALAGALSLVGLAFANSLVGFVIAWVLVQVSFNFAQGPLIAIMPDRAPLKRRGLYSSLAGLGLLVGGLGGSILGSVFFHSIPVGYIFFAVFAVVALTLFVVFNPDHSSEQLEVEPLRLKEFLGTFWVNPIKHPDFFWAFTGRLLAYSAYFIVVNYQLFLLTDYLHIEEPEKIIPVLSLISLSGLLISVLVSGPLSDRIGRRKPFVVAAAIVVAISLSLPLFSTSIEVWMLKTFILGLGFGMFQAVDTALITQVLPAAKSFGKDVGVVNIAATLPQTLAPAVAGAIVLGFGYAALFPVGIVFALLSAVAIWPIKSSR